MFQHENEHEPKPFTLQPPLLLPPPLLRGSPVGNYKQFSHVNE